MSDKKVKQGGIIIPEERITRGILLIRGQKVIIDADLAALYGVSTKALNQAIKRNKDRFPKDFVFLLTKKGKLRWSQIVTTLQGSNMQRPYHGHSPNTAPLWQPWY